MASDEAMKISAPIFNDFRHQAVDCGCDRCAYAETVAAVLDAQFNAGVESAAKKCGDKHDTRAILDLKRGGE